ncbi:hypothetical protein B0J12DRAFT_675898 [Macrophomina phaseolina]|uniref:Uncharacterized protein n=1 Tax=Macrophomina phaseolina TaxID=35725 RepID=A0ABQ8G0U9_9PEZI|nr:hypothetical protein B0J12DRAFT_675898 [Macrophomina phaseolina]
MDSPHATWRLPMPFTAAFHSRAMAAGLAFFDLSIVGSVALAAIPVDSVRHVGGRREEVCVESLKVYQVFKALFLRAKKF